MRHWLFKSEPDAFSIDDLQAAGEEHWDGIRNYQARNLMRDEMQVGDKVLFYHSNAKPPGIAGLASVSRTAYPDHTAWQAGSKYFDKRSTPENPVWLMVNVRFEKKFAVELPLDELRKVPELDGMMLLRKGMRLSIQPVTPEEYATVLDLAAVKARHAGGAD